MPAYNKPIKYSKDPVKFPDFEIVFKGKRKSLSRANIGRTFKSQYYDFDLISDNKTSPLTWSLETSEIKPVEFKVKDKKFNLHMLYYNKFKTYLTEDHILIEEN